MIPSRSAALSVLSILLTVAFVPCPASAEPVNSRAARIVLFVPEGSELPAGHIKKLQSIGVRTEAFYADGIEKWGWKVARREIFARNPDGKIEIVVARGKLPKSATGSAALPVIQKIATDTATKKIGQSAAKQSIWWTFYHCPDHEVKGFRGMSGRAINAYPAVEGEITPTIDLADKAMWPLNLKGCIHEFGHALGLPHIGPKPALKLGNTLMGPINKAFVAKWPDCADDSRVYLSEASAAMLAHHPLFSKASEPHNPKPAPIALSTLSFKEAPDGTFTVGGTVTGKTKIHSAIALDTSRGFGDYWSRPYRAKVDKQGNFSITVDEPFTSKKGMLALYFCLENGRNSGSGKREVLTGDYIEIQYEGAPGKRKFQQMENPTKRTRKKKGGKAS